MSDNKIKIYDDAANSGNLLLRQVLNPKEVRRSLLLRLLEQAFCEPNYEYMPLLVKMNLEKIFGLEKSIHGGKDEYEKFIRNLDVHYSLLKNSSIWIRLVGKNEDDSTNAKQEISWFQKMGLYDTKPAKEFIEYQLRSLRDNYLAEIADSTGDGHGIDITPTIYSNEVEFRDFFLNSSNSRNADFKFLNGSNNGLNENSKADNGKVFKTNNVKLRILLVDDKIGTPDPDHDRSKKAEEWVHKCPRYEKQGTSGCDNCKIKSNNGWGSCKLRVIRELLSGSFIEDKEKQKVFWSNTYWADKVQAFTIDSVKISDVWKKIDEKHIGLKKKEESAKKGWRDINNSQKLNQDKAFVDTLNSCLSIDDNHIQIIGVPDLESALCLLSCCKFDIILLDYLLSEHVGTTGRSYSTELFEFLGADLSNTSNVSELGIVNSLITKPEKYEDDFYREFLDNVKLNRGPLDKFWIIPMTSYNSSFISDLQRKHVRLIDYRWNISQGADPINTPWKFLYKFNEIIDLQLRQSVFLKEQLLTFIQFTGGDYAVRIQKNSREDKLSCFEDFQQFMGAEYANLMKRYGAQRLIQRDALGEGMDYSPFAKYVNDSFYTQYKEYGIETELNRLMQEFYHQAAFMFDDRLGHQRLRESFERLRVFIAYNNLADELDNKNREEFLDSLRLLRVVVDSEFKIDSIKKELDSKKA